MATFEKEMQEYEVTKIQKDDHTYDHIKMEHAINLTWKQWFHIFILILIVCLVSISIGFTVTRFTICVSVTMCIKGYSTLSTNKTVRFPDVRAISGITEISKLRFQNNGVYVCKYPGLYLISVTIVSDTYDAQFLLYKNSDPKMKGLVSKHPQQQSNSDNFEHAVTIVAALQLNVGDSLRIAAGKHRIRIVPYGSCLTIVKLM